MERSIMWCKRFLFTLKIVLTNPICVLQDNFYSKWNWEFVPILLTRSLKRELIRRLELQTTVRFLTATRKLTLCSQLSTKSIV